MTTPHSWIPATLLLFAATFTVPEPTTAQDQFGFSVATDSGEVLVMKAFAGRGPAAVFVFRRADDGTWQVAQQIQPAVAAETGEGFGPSVALTGGTLLVGSGDPAVRLGSHVFRRDGGGAWEESPAIRLGDEADADNAGALDLASLMRILQPPRRVVAIDGNRAAVVVVASAPGSGRLRIFERDDSSSWQEAARLDIAGATANDRFGAALALRGDRVLVGAPQHGTSGAAFLFALDRSTGQWSDEATLTTDSLALESRFGTAVAFDGDYAMVGAPGTSETGGVIVTFSRDPDSGEWSEQKRTAPIESAAADRFGSAMAVAQDELWVGAPGPPGAPGAPDASAGTGRVYRFTRGESTSEWREADALNIAGLEEGFRFGTSVALDENLGLVGAPGADGGRGRAAVFSRSASGEWGEEAWLEAPSALAAITGEEVRCGDDGKAGQFSCQDVDLLAFLPLEFLGGGPDERVSDIWGWTDPQTGREYALVGRTGGAAFVDITDPSAPRYLGFVEANRSGARDLKVYDDHLFFTGDGAGEHGLVVFSLARLRDVRDPPETFEPDATYDGIASAHNLVIDTDAGFAYAVGASGGGETCGGGLHMVDIRDPLNPTFAGCYTDTEGLIYPGRTHDAQCVVYRGPDDAYRGREICFASNETAIRIVDVTDKSNPIPLSTATYPGLSYVHQGWLTDDQRYFYLNDELDELVGQADRTRTLVLDVTDLDDPLVIGQYFGPDGATDHNLYVKGDRMYQANYQAGLRVIDISDRENPVEIGFFDTTPYDGNPPGFNGAWTAYPFFESGTVIVSSMNEGLFLLAPRQKELVP
ncbi:MAG: choice-of-anchor B family protein [Gemmatimonadetes bacterium]|nr:choice-of-anchor B family protein [Gemmatimonadota bacterium]